MAKKRKSSGARGGAEAPSAVPATPAKRATRSSINPKSASFNSDPIAGLEPVQVPNKNPTKPATQLVAWEWAVPDTPEARARAKELNFSGKKISANLIKLCNRTDGYAKFLKGKDKPPTNKDITAKILSKEFGVEEGKEGDEGDESGEESDEGDDTMVISSGDEAADADEDALKTLNRHRASLATKHAALPALKAERTLRVAHANLSIPLAFPNKTTFDHDTFIGNAWDEVNALEVTLTARAKGHAKKKKKMVTVRPCFRCKVNNRDLALGGICSPCANAMQPDHSDEDDDDHQGTTHVNTTNKEKVTSVDTYIARLLPKGTVSEGHRDRRLPLLFQLFPKRAESHGPQEVFPATRLRHADVLANVVFVYRPWENQAQYR